MYADNRIALSDLQASNVLVVRADCPYSRTGEGLHRFVDPADDRVYTYTQFEVPDARRVYATFEQPDLKGVFTFHVTAPEDWLVVSNAPTPEPESLGDGKAIWRFPATERMSTYITAVVAGEYHAEFDTYSGKFGDIPLGHYCRQSLVDHMDTAELVKLTSQGFAFFEEAFDYPYPFHKYDQLYVPEYNMGAMENAGAVTLRDEYLPRSRQDGAFYEFRCSVILHEMAHMWFGDLVTMRWWDDLWLNESFAEWACFHAAVEATEFTESWTGFTNARKNWALRQDQLPSTHPIAADNYDLQAVEVNFDGITYAKGASVLKQLVAWVGLDNFLVGLRAYFKRHAFGNSEFSDLLSALEEASGRELDSWAKEWLQTSGVNTLTPEFDGRRVGELQRRSRYGRRRRSRTRHCAATGSRSASTTSRPTGRRRATGPSYGRRGGCRGRDDRDRGAGRHPPARPADPQRRRPHLRQDPARRALAGHRHRGAVPAGRLARAGPVLGRRLGHDPRRRAERHRLRDASCWATSPARPTPSGPRGSPGTPRRRPTTSPRRPTAPRCARRGSRVCAGCWTRPSPAATTSSPSSGPSRARPTATRRSTTSRGCSTARSSSRV